MENLIQKLMLSGSTAALLAVTSIPSAHAQDNDIEQVVVSASRITVAGYTQPTPVTIVGAAQLANDAYSDIQDSLRSLPQFTTPPADVSSTAGSGSGGNAGEQLLNLRNLGVNRTLVLFDGQRVVNSNITGGVDVSTLPSSLVKRVDVVTGGASAVWGSDAVAGVVNFVLNKNFDGFKANLQAGETVQGINPQQSAEVDWGSDVGSRAHVIFAATAAFKPEPIPVASLDWYKNNKGINYWVQNPTYTPANGQSVYVIANNVGNAQATQGGLITASPGVAGTGTAANSLRGIQFVGNNATPTAVNFGNVTSASISNGGTLGYLDGEGPEENVGVPTTRYTGFAYGSYKVTDTILASLQLNYGYTSVWSRTDPFTMQLTIKSGNPFIPASIQAQMTASGITSFTLGEIVASNFDNTAVTPSNFKSMTQNSANITLFDRRQMMRGVFQLDGTLGDDWGWSGYAEHSTAQISNTTLGAAFKQNIPLAADAVTVTPANVGSSGLPIGSIACSSTLTAPNNANAFSNGCVPLNVFGSGHMTAANLNYLTDNNADYEDMVLNQDMIEGSLQGTLPWGLPAGKPAFAGGANWRQEEADVRAPVYGAQGDFSGAGYGPFPRKSYHVFEGFGELNTPILKDNFVQSLDLDLAGRVTDYSTSGMVETWKIGITSQIDENIRFRGSESVDIRAPQLNELFNADATATQPQVDPKTQHTVQIPVDTQGNPNLLPEVARTYSVGLVLTPSFIPGFTISGDYYAIKVTGEITTIPTATILNQCNPTFDSTIYPGTKGNPNDPLCAVLQFNGLNGALSGITQHPTNIAYQTTDGVDLAADYTMDFWNGKLNWSTVANLDAENTTYNPSSGFNDSIGSAGIPKWRGSVSVNYVTGPLSLTVQNRWIGENITVQNADTGNLATATTANYYPLNQFTIPMIFYFDVRGSYQWTSNIQVYGAVDNLLNKAPPLIPQTFGNIQSQGSLVGTNVTTYDLMGQVVRLGLRFNY